jgi:demethylmacrocin O-methyltransferase
MDELSAEIKELSSIGCKYGTDKVPNGFMPHYVRMFSCIREKAKSIVEIGVLDGASIKTWRDYFPNAFIYGIDCYDKKYLDGNRLKTFVADQSERNQLAAVIEEMGNVDIIIDDGGHSMKQQQVSLGFLFPFVKHGGLYVIEDLHTSVIQPEFFNDTSTDNTTERLLRDLANGIRPKSDFMTDEEIDCVLKETKKCSVEITRIASEEEVDQYGPFAVTIGFLEKTEY